MSWYTKFEAVLSVILRIPPLFLMDSVLNKTFLSFVMPYDPNMTWSQFIFWFLVMTFFFSCGIVMFLLSIRQLLDMYSYVGSIVILALSYWWNYSFVLQVEDEHTDTYAPYHKSFADILEGNHGQAYTNFLVQFVFAWLYYMAWTSRKASLGYDNFFRSLVQTGMHISFISPMILKAVTGNDLLFQWSPMLALVYPAVQISNDFFTSITNMVFMGRRMYNIIKVTISAIGIQAFIEDQWMRLQVPKVLRVFCVTRILYQLSFHINIGLYEEPPQVAANEELKTENITLILQALLVRSCETFVSLLGTTSIVSYIAHYIGILMAYCVGSDTEEDRNMGTVSAILFFLLALQTGLTTLEPEKRIVRLYRNFSLLSAAILHFVHSMVNPILLSLSASRNMSIKKHLRVLGMCVFLVVYPICLVRYLWENHIASPWLLAVTAFSIEVIIKVFVSLTVYTLFIVDAYRDTFWEKLDDYIYYIQSTGNTIEFLFGIFMFCNGGWIMVFESGGAIRALMMCVHAYLNIFVQAKEGWKVFMKRRTAVNKINLLKEASKEELERLNDVCAICYQDLKTARVTRCNHYFHSVCLRKWLYVQDNCPLCHKVIYKPPEEPNGNDGSSESMDAANQNNLLVPNGAALGPQNAEPQGVRPVVPNGAVQRADIYPNHVHPHHL